MVTVSGVSSAARAGAPGLRRWPPARSVPARQGRHHPRGQATATPGEARPRLYCPASVRNRRPARPTTRVVARARRPAAAAPDGRRPARRRGRARPDRAGHRRARPAVRRRRARAGAGRRSGARRDARPAAQRPRLHDLGAPRRRPRRCCAAGRTRSGTWAAHFGTIGCRKGPWQVEITTYRSESYDPDSRKPDVDFGDTLAGDLGRRDFTVNAMAVRLPGRALEDPYGGVVDLAHRVLRTPGRPEDSFSDDPLRMMRAARFAAQLGFSVAPEVVAAMTAMADRIEIISAERVRDELVKLVCSPYPRRGLAPARRDRARRPGAARAARADARARRAPPAQGRLRAHADRAGAGDRPRGAAAGRRPGLRGAVRGADARRRQAAHPQVPRRRHGDLPPPRRGRRQAHPQADEGAALLQRRDRRGRASWSSCTCASTATAPASGPTPPCAATSATPATSSSGCTC